MSQREQELGANTKRLLDSLAQQLDVARISGPESHATAYRRRILPMYIVLAAADIRFVGEDSSTWFEKSAAAHLDVMHDDWITQYHRALEALGSDRGPGFMGMTLQPAAHRVLEQHPPVGFENVRRVVQEEYDHEQRMAELARVALQEFDAQAVKM